MKSRIGTIKLGFLLFSLALLCFLVPRTKAYSYETVSAPIRGEAQFIAIMIEFPDLQDGKNAVQLDSDELIKVQKMIAEDGGIQIGFLDEDYPIVPMKEFFKKYSYGKFSLTWNSFPQDDSGRVLSYISKKPSGYYMEKTAENPDGYELTDPKRGERILGLVREAADAVRPQLEKKFTREQLDKNNDNYIDAVAFFIAYPKNALEPESYNLLYPMKYPGGVENFAHGLPGEFILLPVTNMEMQRSVFSHKVMSDGSIKLYSAEYSTIFHELGHLLFGLKDLYRVRRSLGVPVGSYDIMSTNNYLVPQGYLAESLRKLEFIPEIPVLEPNVETTIYNRKYKDDTERSAVKINIPGVNDQYIVAEFYKNRNINSDPSDRTGLLVYRVNGKYSFRELFDDDRDYYMWKRYRYGNLYGKAGKYTQERNPEYGPDKDYIYIYRSGEQVFADGTPNDYEVRLREAVINTPGVYGKLKSETNGQWMPDTYYLTNSENTGIQIHVTGVTEDSVTFKYTFEEIPVENSTEYSIKHFKQNLEDDEYTLAETSKASISLGATANITPKSYTGFTLNSSKSPLSVLIDVPNKELELYYDRNTYSIKFPDKPATKEKYGAVISLPSPNKVDGKIFKNWGGDNLVPGYNYIVEGDKEFVPVWQDIISNNNDIAIIPVVLPTTQPKNDAGESNKEDKDTSNSNNNVSPELPQLLETKTKNNTLYARLTEDALLQSISSNSSQFNIPIDIYDVNSFKLTLDKDELNTMIESGKKTIKVSSNLANLSFRTSYLEPDKTTIFLKKIGRRYQLKVSHPNGLTLDRKVTTTISAEPNQRLYIIKNGKYRLLKTVYNKNSKSIIARLSPNQVFVIK